MTDQQRLQELRDRSRLPDPCTLVFTVPEGAPPRVDVDGRTWSVQQWIYLAGRHGHAARRADSRTGHGTATWCGDIDVDGLTYQVHRGPRMRILALYVQNDGTEAGRFELRESTWVEPVPPQPVPNTCPWCTLGPPRILRHAAQQTVDAVYVIAASENPDGSGRTITIQTDPDHLEDRSGSYCVTLEPGHATHYGGIISHKIATGRLTLRLTPEAAHELQVEPNLIFDLALDDQQLATLRTGLQRTLSPHRQSST